MPIGPSRDHLLTTLLDAVGSGAAALTTPTSPFEVQSVHEKIEYSTIEIHR